MEALAAPLLAEGLKGWLEDPALLLGVPLVLLGLGGMFLVLAPVGTAFLTHGERPTADMDTTPGWVYVDEGHPGPETYIQVGLILAVITAIEVAIVYVDLIQGLFIGVLLALSALKFVLVVLWFMHLRFDNRLFSTLFTGGLLLAAALFSVVLATLGSNLV